MKLIKAINKQTGKVKYFGSRADLRSSEVAIGASKFASQIISRALSHKSDQCGFNGWKLFYIEVDDAKFEQAITNIVKGDTL